MSTMPADYPDFLRETEAPTPRLSVTPVGDAPAPVLAPAAPGSPLANLRKRVAAARATRYLDLRVPDLGNPTDPFDPEALFVRYRAMTNGEMSTIGEKWDARTDLTPDARDWGASVDTLVTTCLGVFTVEADGHPVGAPSSWPRFGPEMATQMGMDLSGTAWEQASGLLREFYVADGDVTNVAYRLMQYSKRDGLVVERQNPEA